MILLQLGWLRFLRQRVYLRFSDMLRSTAVWLHRRLTLNAEHRTPPSMIGRWTEVDRSVLLFSYIAISSREKFLNQKSDTSKRTRSSTTSRPEAPTKLVRRIHLKSCSNSCSKILSAIQAHWRALATIVGQAHKNDVEKKSEKKWNYFERQAMHKTFLQFISSNKPPSRYQHIERRFLAALHRVHLFHRRTSLEWAVSQRRRQRWLDVLAIKKVKLAITNENKRRRYSTTAKRTTASTARSVSKLSACCDLLSVVN